MSGIKILSKTEMVDKLFYGEEPLSLLSNFDKEWLLKMANEGNIHAACLLVHGMHYKYSRGWKEMFINEETGEVVLIIRIETSRGTTFAKSKALESQLMKMILESIKSMTNEELWTTAELVYESTPLYLELVDRGEDKAIGYLPVELIKDFAEKGNKFAAEIVRHENL